MRFSLLFCFILTFALLSAQSWQSLTYNVNQPNLELNPLKGFATMWAPSNNFPKSIQGRLFGLDEVMNGPDDFDWTVIDNFLAQEAVNGNHAYIQVNIDPAFGETHLPAYLIDLVETYYYQDPNPNGVDDLCPDWNDPDLMAAMLNFIERFGERYNGDPRIFMVHLGLYGMWGEWHIGDVENVRPDLAMTDANKSLIANAYLSAFPNTHLLARYPQNMPDPQAFGYSDGLFFSQSISDNIPYYFHNILKSNNAGLNWQRLPIGGEIDPALQSTIWNNWPNTVGQDVLKCFDSIRPTWLFAHHNFTQLVPNTAAWNNAITAQKMMGYRLYVDQYRLTATNGKATVELKIKNNGFAPFYADWEVEFGAIDAGNNFRYLGKKKINLFLIQPDSAANYRSFFSDTTLTDGTYTAVIKVRNPLEIYSANAKPVRFANSSQDQQLSGWLTLGQMTITGGNAGTPPIKVTGISVTPAAIELLRNSTFQLTANVLPSNASNPGITWVSDRPGTVSVNANGLITTKSIYGSANIYAYTQDGGFMAVCQVTVVPVMVPIPALIQAEDFTDMYGVVVENLGGGNYNLGYINQGDWMEYGVVVSETSAFVLDYRVSSAPGGGQISFRDQNHNILDVLNIPSTGWWGNYTTLTSRPFVLKPGAYIIRLLASQGGFNIDWLEFKAGPALLSSYTFHGNVNNQFYNSANWLTNQFPPNGFGGNIYINSDCIRPLSSPFIMDQAGQCILAPNVTFTIR
ncbi:MAG: carbohydrate-binding protein [Saprospiraceae bacterium]|nr:carbohydrate-binding protein [Saprospiraceae bacterium]